MTVSTLGSSSSVQNMQALMGRSGPPKDGGGAIAVAAKALGLRTDDVISQLKSGKSLGDIADAQGVSRDDLAAALKSGLPDGLSSSPDADQIVNNIINQVGMPQHHPHGGGSPSDSASSSSSIAASVSGVLGTSLTSTQQSTLDSLSSLLGTDSDSLMSSLQSGTSLADLVSAAGVSEGSLASILQDGLLIDTTA